MGHLTYLLCLIIPRFVVVGGETDRDNEMPAEIDERVAALKLKTMGITIDELTDEQKEYLSSWEHGTRI